MLALAFAVLTASLTAASPGSFSLDDVTVVMRGVTTGDVDRAAGDCEESLVPGRSYRPGAVPDGILPSSNAAWPGSLPRFTPGDRVLLFASTPFPAPTPAWRERPMRADVTAAPPFQQCLDRRQLRLVGDGSCRGLDRHRQHMLTSRPGGYAIAVRIDPDNAAAVPDDAAAALAVGADVARLSVRSVPAAGAFLERVARAHREPAAQAAVTQAAVSSVAATSSLKVARATLQRRSWEIVWGPAPSGLGVITTPDEEEVALDGVLDVIGVVALEGERAGFVLQRIDEPARGRVGIYVVEGGHLVLLRWLLVPNTCP